MDNQTTVSRRKPGSGLLLRLQCLPILRRAAGMGDDNGTTHNVCHGKDLVHLIGRDTLIVAFAKVILDAVVATEHHAGHEAQHFLGAHGQGALGIGIGIEIEEAVDDLILLAEDHLIHLSPVVVEFFNLVHIRSINAFMIE